MTTYSKNTTLAILGSLLLLAGSCEVKSEQNVPSRSWELTWSDEFNGNADALPDTSKWKFDLGAGGWGNNELQNYTNRPSNISLDGNGALRITAKEEAYAGAGFTSARIKTQNVFTQKYGRFEARIKTPTGPGIWPAFWMLGSNIPQVSWPKCGEIDIMEQRGQESFITHGTLHGPGYSGGNAITKSYALTNGRFNTNYHVYAVEWGEDFVDFFVDDYLYKSVKKADVKGEWVYNQPFFLLLNVAVGGNFVGFPVKGTPFPQTMYIDYVKVYKQK